MSYAFNTLARAWAVLRTHLPDTVQGSEIGTRFEFMLEELHECDHRLRGAINRDEGVTAKAVSLERVMRKITDEGAS